MTTSKRFEQIVLHAEKTAKQDYMDAGDLHSDLAGQGDEAFQTDPVQEETIRMFGEMTSAEQDMWEVAWDTTIDNLLSDEEDQSGCTDDPKKQ